MKDYELEQLKHKSGRNYRVGLWRTNKTSPHDGKFCETRITWLQPCEVQEWAIENGYREGLEIDRIDGTKDYEPLNCRWATRMIQMNNIRTNRIIELFGVSHTVSEWAKLVDSNGDRILDRLKLGWDEYSSVFAPKYYNYNKLGGFNLDRKLFQEVIGNQCQ